MDILNEIMHDLNYIMEVGSELGYNKEGDHIIVEVYDDDGEVLKRYKMTVENYD